MKNFSLLLVMCLFIYIPRTLIAQQAGWIEGDSTRNEIASYGTKGVTVSTNKPGGRENAIGWVDASSNFWLFGGFGYIGSSSQGYLNDLWRYDGSDWTWIAGENTANPNGEYGTKGFTSSSSIPGGRQSSSNWIDGSGNLWFLGGQGRDGDGNTGLLNDLWKYDGSDWTWVSGDSTRNQSGVYGTKGVAAGSNILGARYESTHWLDGSGNFWVFGGYAYDNAGNQGYLNDLWRWDGTNWTWISGSDTRNENGEYGTKGVTASSNIPGARWEMMYWIDASDNLWIFGGQGRDGDGNLGYLNDLWRWDGTNWTWVSGDSTRNQSGVYGTKGTASASNMPGGHYKGVSWIDDGGNFLFFGGWGYDAGGSQGYMNNFWRYDGSNWTWLYGNDSNSQDGEYGSKGVASGSNYPGARQDITGWINANDLWLFGGTGRDGNNSTGKLNDLWNISDAALPVALTGFAASLQDDKVLLKWETATEVNNYGFEIERQQSENGTQNTEWKTIGFVQGHGNSSSPKQYEFVDNDPTSGYLQYRLKQIDTDGTFEYYETTAELNNVVTTVEANPSTDRQPIEFSLKQNYPNPFNPSTTIRYSIPVVALSPVEGQQVLLKVFDVLGNEVAQLVNKSQAPGIYQVVFNATNLSSGMYVYKIDVAGRFSVQRKMLLIKPVV